MPASGLEPGLFFFKLLMKVEKVMSPVNDVSKCLGKFGNVLTEFVFNYISKSSSKNEGAEVTGR